MKKTPLRMLWVAAIVWLSSSESVVLAEPPREFFVKHCYDCHQGTGSAAGLDLEQFESNLDSESHFDTWVKVFDRVSSGEMPPPEESEPVAEAELSVFRRQTEEWLHDHQAGLQDRRGRVQGRRLTNLQLERTLHDLLGIDIPLEREMPEEPKSEHYSTLASRQSISHFHLEQHVKIVDLALDEAFRRALTPEDERRWEMTAEAISRDRRRTRTREPEYIDEGAVVWSSTLSFYGRLPVTTAPVAGWYRFHFEVASLNTPEQHGVCGTIRSGMCVSGAPLMTWVAGFEATREPRVVTVDAWLPKGHMLEVRPGDATLKRAKFRGGQAGNGEGGPQNVPGIRINWLKMERVHQGPDDEHVRRGLFGELPVPLTSGLERGQLLSQANVRCDDPAAQGRALVEDFAQRAFRRPVDAKVMNDFVRIFQEALDDGASLAEALRAGYRAILCSARFLYFHEPIGELDSHAIASRLSYLLWNSMPDEPLLRLAKVERLAEPEVLRQQVNRMLASRRGRQFVADFAREWLELSEIDFTIPDRKSHPDFDALVQNAMLEETHHFLQEMLEENTNVRQFVRCDHTYANSRLARFYGLDALEGNQTRRVPLPTGVRRGGLLSQGSILKVTANGTNTSPVLRGVWVARRILGVDIPAPPDNVPAIEPDIRGATTIREQLEKHRSLTECSACHRKIDAPGFALENFDAAGKWRDRYLRIEGRTVSQGAKIDAGYVTAAGEEFDGFESYCQLVSKNLRPIARNFAQQLLVYGTGAEISFADRREIDRIVHNVEAEDFGMRSILNEVVTSRIFLTK